jgi:hypothetical protein
MKTGDILVTGGAIAALAAVGWFAYGYLKGLGSGNGSAGLCAGIDTARACNLVTGVTTCCGASVPSQTVPGQIDQKFTITGNGDVTIASPKDITANPCPTGYYKTAAAAMNAFVQAHGGGTISGTWRYEYYTGRPECWKIASVLTSGGSEIK